MTGLMPIILSEMDGGGGHDFVLDKTIEKRLSQTITGKKIEVMSEYLEDGMVDKEYNRTYSASKLKHYNKVFKRYISGMKRRGLKAELNTARKKLYQEYKAELWAKE